MQTPTVSKIRIGKEEFPLVEFYPVVGKRIVLFAGTDDHFKPIIDKGYIIRVYPNGSFMMSDESSSKLVDGVVVGITPKNPRIYDSTYKYIVSGA